MEKIKEPDQLLSNECKECNSFLMHRTYHACGTLAADLACAKTVQCTIDGKQHRLLFSFMADMVLLRRCNRKQSGLESQEKGWTVCELYTEKQAAVHL